MKPDPVIHYHPNGRVLIVKSFSNENLLTTPELIQLDLTSVTSISVSKTVRNSPGTFSFAFMDIGCTMFVPDNPVAEVPEMWQNALQQRSVDQASVRKNSIDRGGTSYFEFPTYDDWLNFEHIVLEVPNSFPLTRHNTYYLRGGAVGGDGIRTIVQRWSFDLLGNTIKLPADMNDYNDGSTITTTVSGKSTSFIVRRYSNKKLLDLTSANGLDQKRGTCKIQAMDRVVIFLSKRFKQAGDMWIVDQSEAPELVRSFTGLVNRVGVAYSENNATISVEGEDVTKFMRISTFNVDPAAPEKVARRPVGTHIQESSSITFQPVARPGATSRFSGVGVADIIKVLTIGYWALDENTKRKLADRHFEEPGIGVYRLATGNKASSWVYNPERGRYITKDPSGKPTSISFFDTTALLGTLFTDATVHVFNPSNTGLPSMTPYEIDVSGWTKWQGELQNRLEIAYKVASDIGFHFYADRNGEIWFTPPRYSNSWILSAPNPKIYVIDPESILSYSFVESDESVVTTIYASTIGDIKSHVQQELDAMGYIVEYQENSLVFQYGVRVLTIHNPLIGDRSLDYLLFFAKQKLLSLLADRLQGQITITGRPELDPGYPVVVPFGNRIYFAETVEDSLQVNNEYSTTISLSHGHKPWDFVPEFMTFGHDQLGGGSGKSTKGKTP